MFDAHTDLNTPAQTVSGYLDGMGVSMLTGQRWKVLMATVPGHRPLALRKYQAPRRTRFILYLIISET